MLAVIFLGEHVYWNTVVGVVLLIGASVLILRDAWGSKRLNIEEVHAIDEIFARHESHAADKRRYFSCMLPLVELGGKDHIVLATRGSSTSLARSASQAAKCTTTKRRAPARCARFARSWGCAAIMCM